MSFIPRMARSVFSRFIEVVSGVPGTGFGVHPKQTLHRHGPRLRPSESNLRAYARSSTQGQAALKESRILSSWCDRASRALISRAVAKKTSRVVLALDFGKIRVGVAVSDDLGLLAHPRPPLDARNRAELLRHIA